MLTVRMQVPNDMVGRIIGRGGATIAEIRQQSDARVDIAAHIPGQLVRDLSIIGSSTQVQQAQMLVLSKMSQIPD